MDSSSSSVVSEGRGIPGDSFVEDVLKYLSKSGLDVNSFLAFLQERLTSRSPSQLYLYMAASKHHAGQLE
ncbi:hypothetical protein HHK36_026315 [Tetracentron sinense]|uniref:Uncharacterized protein n=1 Tax=Tetracentron sinense TaxID=13715 RepID=A0A835D2I3_TETSI|nr:hypothetical protein HHK36_026315 [Tetracentron sinense]